MSCPEFDWKAYALDELSAADRARAREHASVCPLCAEEVERLQVTRAALLSIPNEEPPRRIAFVSDKVFEPNWWQRFWASAPRLGFASAAMLSVAILVAALTRPAPAPVASPVSPDRAQVAALVEQEVQRRLPIAIAAVVAESNQSNEEKTAKLVAAAEHRLEFAHRAEMLAVEDNLTILRRRLNQAYVAYNSPVSNELAGKDNK
ncbi:MAG: hypothetical protein ABI693_29125 [Bryobacteraceae bacterium]